MSERTTPCSECPVNLEALNAFVLAVIALFALCLYVAVVVTGVAGLTSQMSTFSNGKKRSKSQNASGRRRNATRRSPHP